jgi:hypothetical protein
VDDTGGRLEDQNVRRNADSEGHSWEVSDGKRALIGIGLENVCASFWQRTCLYFSVS